MTNENLFEYFCYSKLQLAPISLTNIQLMEQTLNWYAVYTRSRHEKKSAQLLTDQGIEAYVPLKRVVRQWSDRRKLVLEPVIRGYLFVKVDHTHYEKVLSTDGVVRYVWFNGKPAIIPEKQINTLKAVVGTDVEIECLPESLKPGVAVRVIAGPLAGLEGELLRMAGKHKVVVRLHALQQMLAVTLSPLLLEPIQAVSSIHVQ